MNPLFVLDLLEKNGADVLAIEAEIGIEGFIKLVPLARAVAASYTAGEAGKDGGLLRVINYNGVSILDAVREIGLDKIAKMLPHIAAILKTLKAMQ